MVMITDELEPYTHTQYVCARVYFHVCVGNM